MPGPDAAALLLPLFGLARDDRAHALVGQIVRQLGCGPYLRRYPPGPVAGESWDGFSGREGAFLPASFQAVAALAVVGELDQATARLDDMCAALPRLLAEMVDPVDGTSLGNVPLLWSHMELVRALYVLDSEQRRRRFGTAGLWLWRAGRYLSMRRARG